MVLTGRGRRRTPRTARSESCQPVERPKPAAVECVLDGHRWLEPSLSTSTTTGSPTLWLLLLSRLRHGEALGLKWDDIDLGDGRLAVRRALVAVGYDVQWSEPKTPKSRRVVALDAGTVASLKVHRKHQLEERMALGSGYRDDDIVFAKVDGSPIHPQTVSKSFEHHAKAAGLPRIRLHDCRHTAATMLLDQGVPLKVVSERLGHSSVSITADLYQHTLEHMQQDAADKAGAMLLGDAFGSSG